MDRHCINYSVGQFISVTQIIYLINFCLINEYKWDSTVVLVQVPSTLLHVLFRIKRDIQKMATYWFMTRVTIVRRVNVTHTWQWFWDFDSHEHHDWCLVDSISLIPFDVEISLYHSRIWFHWRFRALHLYSAKLLTRN